MMLVIDFMLSILSKHTYRSLVHDVLTTKAQHILGNHILSFMIMKL